ncbi:angiopoietin-related protein 1-like [Anopheles darlingi]|uniref:angiopoietin-related protein 1-like n=1 Tax=Anopheles darlingi TaxID=43151 RepID=UPI0021002D45|nr:angiopoietin-related protein 1-like [Anopheles darlingi]
MYTHQQQQQQQHHLAPETWVVFKVPEGLGNLVTDHHQVHLLADGCGMVEEKGKIIRSLSLSWFAHLLTSKFDKEINGATSKSSDTVDATSQATSLDGIMGFGLELILTKLDHVDHQLRELREQMDGLQEKMVNVPFSHEKTPTASKHNALPFTSCRNASSSVSGVYLISASNATAPFKVYCEQELFGGGWIVVQHRFDGSVDFYQNWDQYRDGFGELDGEFWLGLERMHQLTSARAHEIIFEMKDMKGAYEYARYNAFKVGSESEKYKVKTLGSHSGTARDGMRRGEKFSTKDRDNDGSSEFHWAVHYEGAWWFSFFGGAANLNGRYSNNGGDKSIWWWNTNSNRGIYFTRMMIREL